MLGPRLESGGSGGGPVVEDEKKKKKEKDKEQNDSGSTPTFSDDRRRNVDGSGESFDHPQAEDYRSRAGYGHGAKTKVVADSESQKEKNRNKQKQKEHDAHEAEQNRSGAGYGNGAKTKVVADSKSQKEKNREKKKSDGVLAGISHAIDNPGETASDTVKGAQETWHGVDEGTKEVVDTTLDNDTFSVQDTIRGSAQYALGYDDKQQFAREVSNLAGVLKDHTQGKVAAGTPLDNPITSGVVDAGTFLGESLVADPAKTVVTGLTGLDVDKGTAEGEVGAAGLADVALSVVGEKAAMSGLRGAKYIAGSDEAARVAEKIGLKYGDDGVRVLDDAINLSEDALKSSDEVGDVARTAEKTGLKSSDNLAANAAENSRTESRLAKEIENYKKTITGGSDETAEAAVKSTDDAVKTAEKSADDIAEATAKSSDDLSRTERVVKGLTKTRGRKAVTAATAAGGTAVLGGTLYSAGGGFETSDTGTGDGSGSTGTGGNGNSGSDGSGTSDTGGSGSGGATWGQLRKAEVLESGWVLGYQQVFSGSRRRWFVTGIMEKGGPLLALTASGTSTEVPKDGERYLLNEAPSFETETAARNANKKWMKNREYNDGIPDGTNGNDDADGNGNGNQPGSGNSQWGDWHQMQQVMMWNIWGRSHVDGKQVQLLASGSLPDQTTIYLTADGMTSQTPVLFDSADALQSALDAYATNVQNGTISKDQQPTGSGPNREEISKTVRESHQTQSNSKSTVEKLMGKKIALAAVGVAGVAVLAAGGGDGGAPGGVA
ncbi:hypothetical protein ZOD2009_19133 [Haladaptatus paucihalophilus DX253]|nr:hypothetical protein ZOD2009_19133 [Haladaptatus paucihalophilus DX253]